MYRDKTFEQAMNEHMDIYDEKTRKVFLALDESGQTEALTAITSKLYDKIVEKVDDIDFGDIPLTKGDIEKLPTFEKLVECTDILRDLLVEYKQSTDSIDVIVDAIQNVRQRRDVFTKAYVYNLELPMVIYNTICLAIVSSISILISSSVEYIKTPSNDSFELTLDKTGLYKSKDYMLFNDLKKFNRMCKTGELDRGLKYIIDNHVKKFTGVEIGLLAGTIATAAIIFNIIPIIRELIFFFYYSKTRAADYFEMQANLLQMNAYNLQANDTVQKEDRDAISKKQFKIVDLFRKISNFIGIKSKSADVSASKELVNDNKKYKVDDVMDHLPDSAASALF